MSLRDLACAILDDPGAPPVAAVAALHLLVFGDAAPLRSLVEEASS